MNRSYVVTGGARGIGRAIAGRLAADGHVVVLDLVAANLGLAAPAAPPRCVGFSPPAAGARW